MDVAEITHRHHTELAVTWWRRETSPMLLLRGLPDAYEELDQKMAAYMDGAGLNTASVFAHLIQHQNRSAPDFVADMVAAFLASSVGGAGEPGKAWYATVQTHPHVDQAVQDAKRWLGRTGVLPEDDDSDDILAWHGPQHLRFIDSLGVVRGHFIPSDATQGSIGPKTETTSPNHAVSKLCSALLYRAPDDRSTQWLAQAHLDGIAIEAQLMAAGISGQASLLESLLNLLATCPDVILATLDAIRRITGFDALQTVQADRQLPHAIEPEQIANAKSHAQQWLGEHIAKFHPDERYALGQPVSQASQASKEHLQNIVQHGYPVDREVAAMRLYLDPKPCLIPVRSRGPVQRRWMAQHFN